MTGTDLAVIITITVGYVASTVATLRYITSRIEQRIDRLEARMDRLEDRLTGLESAVHDMAVVLARIDERLGHLEHRP